MKKLLNSNKNKFKNIYKLLIFLIKKEMKMTKKNIN